MANFPDIRKRRRQIELVFVLLISILILSSCQLSKGKSTTLVDASCPDADDRMKVILQGPDYASSGKCASDFRITVGKGVLVSESRELEMHSSCDERLFRPIPVAESTQVELKPAGLGVFYADAECSQSLSSVTIPEGSSHVEVFFMGSKEKRELAAEPVPVNLTAKKLASSTQIITLTDGSATELEIDGPKRVSNDECTRFEVTRRDSAGNPSNRQDAVLAGLEVIGALGREYFFADEKCQKKQTEVRIPSGKASGAFYFKGKTEKLSKIHLMSYEQGDDAELRPARHTVIVAPK